MLIPCAPADGPKMSGQLITVGVYPRGAVNGMVPWDGWASDLSRFAVLGPS